MTTAKLKSAVSLTGLCSYIKGTVKTDEINLDAAIWRIGDGIQLDGSAGWGLTTASSRTQSEQNTSQKYIQFPFHCGDTRSPWTISRPPRT